MRVLVEILHPAQVHFFRFVVDRLRQQGHEVLVVARQKDVTVDLLESLGWDYRCLSQQGQSLTGLVRELGQRYWRLWWLARRFRPDVMLGLTGVTIGLVGALLGVPRVVLEEAEHACLQRWIGLPFASRIMTGTGYLQELGARQVRFRGIWPQAYLDPRYFQPDPNRIRQAGINPDEPYIVLRTVSWQAAHDAGHEGASIDALHDAVTRLARYGRVIISAEGELPASLTGYANPAPIQDIHHLLAFAALHIGEGGTMAAEAAVLGTPAIFCSHLRCGYLLALEREYGLLHIFDDLTTGVARAQELLERPDLRQEWRDKQQRLLCQSDDIAAFVLEQIRQVTS